MQVHHLRLAGVIIVVLTGIIQLHAQSYEADNFRRLNSNAAVVVSIPSNPTAKYARPSWGLVYGAGYNFDRHHAVLGEFMWDRLSPTNSALAPIQQALQNSDLHGDGYLLSLTTNYRLQHEGRVFGAYLIAGGGVYHRNTTLSQHITVGKSVTCNQAWLWWGFTCSSGFVTSDQTLAGHSSTAPGGNIGVGFTIRIPDSEYKFYVESRYHYAVSSFVVTKVVPITIGFRF